jgi:hypothetical protein
LIKIRYTDLPAGLHVRVEERGRSTLIYLLPGLTLAQRRSALLRARRSASMGYGPRLPALGVAAAVARDRTKTTIHNGLAAVRSHPALALPGVVVLCAAVVYLMTSTVSITLHPPQANAVNPSGTSTRARHDAAGSSGRLGISGADHPDPSAGGQGPGRHHGKTQRPPRSHSHSPAPSRSRHPRPGPSTSDPAPTRSSSPPTSSSPSPTTSTTAPTPSPSPSPTSSSNCLNLGPLGICLSL